MNTPERTVARMKVYTASRPNNLVIMRACVHVSQIHLSIVESKDSPIG